MAKGFHPNESVGVIFTPPNNAILEPFVVPTDDQGSTRSAVTWRIPEGMWLGRWAITFEGVQSHITKIEYFQLIP
jgi:hypothetical protein